MISTKITKCDLDHDLSITHFNVHWILHINVTVLNQTFMWKALYRVCISEYIYWYTYFSIVLMTFHGSQSHDQ